MNDLSKDIDPIPAGTMADRVETKLREYLKKKSFRPGDPLPKEQELADALGVSRNVVREALSRLRMLGMVDSRKKRGMILTEPDILGSLERVLDPLIMSKDTLQDLFELRLVLEMGLADLLYIRMQPADLEELQAIADREKPGVSQIFRIEQEVAFHGKLYRMTGNDTFIRFQQMLLPVFDYTLSLESMAGGRPETGAVSHRDLVEILKTGTAGDFRNGMSAHLKPHFNRIR